MSEHCAICGCTTELCICAGLLEDHSGESLCETCPDKTKCDEREAEPAILHAQMEHCHCVVGRADYHTDEQWIFDWQQEEKQ